jgi:hypothetical protein
MNINIDKELEKIIASFQIDLQKVIISNLEDIDIESDSNLIKQITNTFKNDTITIELNEYVIFVDSGRNPLVRRVPIKALIDWIRRYRIKFDNLNEIQTAYVIQSSIYKKGIRPRPVLKKISSDLNKTIIEQNKKIGTLLNFVFDELPKN